VKGDLDILLIRACHVTHVALAPYVQIGCAYDQVVDTHVAGLEGELFPEVGHVDVLFVHVDERQGSVFELVSRSVLRLPREPFVAYHDVGRDGRVMRHLLG